jgi:hypothetical protein
MPGLVYDAPFFPGARHDPGGPAPDAVLGFQVGIKPATHAQIEAVIKAVASSSPRCRLFEYAKSHEGRALYYLVIASEANIARLDQIQVDAAKLADARSVSAAEADRLADTLPAIAWMGYAIHGDELSGSDAALAAAHHLAASTDDDVKSLLNELVVIIDPLMNPDGRDRCLHDVAENRTSQPNVDDQSLIHSLVWPSGRMNHYLFDMNRDWIFGTQPESRGRIAAASKWHPHYFMESHEMGSQDTFLFMPPRQPINPNLPPNVHKWLDVFAKDLAAAFDRHGWRYYTGEWNEEWYPGYSGAWGGLRNAVENLYEQASITTDAVRRLEGRLETYREAVHHQLVSTMTNLTTLAANRRAVLKDYLAERRKNVAAAPEGKYAARTFAVVPSANASRLRTFTDLMAMQGFEVYSTPKELIATARDRLGREIKDKRFPPGTILIPNRQPEGPLVAAMLEFDPRMTPAFLTEERRELLRFDRSRLYDITGWNITMLFDVEGYELATDLPTGAVRLAGAARSPGLEKTETSIGFVVNGADDRSVALAGRLMERGVQVRVTDKPFKFDGRDFPSGSVVVLRVDNRTFSEDLNQTLGTALQELDLSAMGIESGLGPGDLPDIGGEHFVLLQQPRIAVLGREPSHPYSYGEIWHLIDHKLGLRASYLDATQAGWDLRRYNVIVLPHGANAEELKSRIEALKTWAQAGGTLVAVGSSAAALAREQGIGSVRVLADVLTKLDEHRQAIVREWEGRVGVADASMAWSQTPPAQVVYPWLIGQSGDKPTDDELKRRDAWREIFMPQGAIVATRVDDRSWLTGGCGEYLPVLYRGSAVLMTTRPGTAPIRLGVIVPLPPGAATQPATMAGTQPATQPDQTLKPGWTLAPPSHELRLRMSGLLWPEAADRIAHSAYVTREQIGSGQVILFSDSPTFRAAALGTSRVFANAVVYGPGMGATQPIKP